MCCSLTVDLLKQIFGSPPPIVCLLGVRLLWIFMYRFCVSRSFHFSDKNTQECNSWWYVICMFSFRRNYTYHFMPRPAMYEWSSFSASMFLLFLLFLLLTFHDSFFPHILPYRRLSFNLSVGLSLLGTKSFSFPLCEVFLFPLLSGRRVSSRIEFVDACSGIQPLKTFYL